MTGVTAGIRVSAAGGDARFGVHITFAIRCRNRPISVGGGLFVGLWASRCRRVVLASCRGLALSFGGGGAFDGSTEVRRWPCSPGEVGSSCAAAGVRAAWRPRRPNSALTRANLQRGGGERIGSDIKQSSEADPSGVAA